MIWLRFLSACALVALVVYMAFNYEWSRAPHALVLSCVLILLGLLQWAIGVKTNCPLCMVPGFAPTRCSRHSKARRLFGSARLMAAAGILLSGRLRCPYCDSAVRMRVSDHRRR